MKDLMKKKAGIALCATRVLAIAVGLLMNAMPASAQSSETDGWRTLIYPIHAWLPVFGADVRLPEVDNGDGSGVTIPQAQTSGNFNGAALAGFRLERRRLSVEGEFLWAGMSGNVTLPSFKLNLDTISGKLIGGVQIARALYVDGGVRRYAISMKASILDRPEVDWKPGIWEPVVGLTFRPEFRRTLRLFTQAEYGGIGDDSHKSSSVTALLEWRPMQHLTIGAGYGLMHLRADGTILTKPVHFSQTLNGPMLTLGLVF
jgi:hypothetical protein